MCVKLFIASYSYAILPSDLWIRGTQLVMRRCSEWNMVDGCLCCISDAGKYLQWRLFEVLIFELRRLYDVVRINAFNCLILTDVYTNKNIEKCEESTIPHSKICRVITALILHLHQKHEQA